MNDSRAPHAALVLLRLYLGAAFLNAASGKIGASWTPWPGWMDGVIRDRMPGSVPLYRAFLESVVLPHVAFFAHAVACGEVVVGCLLVAGLATRAAAALGMCLTLNYLLLNGAAQLVPAREGVFTLGSNDPVFVLGCLALLVGSAGRAFGVDYFVHRRFPAWPLS
ncbi:MAG TPA: DoxX family membrane protein [Gemmatimonadales bacterium]|nr:DoxX family membrane protein [Gemmatimonadales bacterium]